MTNSDYTVDMDTLVKQIKTLSQSKQLALQEMVDRLVTRITGNDIDQLSIIDSFLNLLVPPAAPSREQDILYILDEYKFFIQSLDRPGQTTPIIRSALAQGQECTHEEITDDESIDNDQGDVLSNEEALAMIDRLTGELTFQYKLLTEPRYQDANIQSDFPTGSEPGILGILAKLTILKSLVLLS